jgi:HEAT repeat protein
MISTSTAYALLVTCLLQGESPPQHGAWCGPPVRALIEDLEHGDRSARRWAAVELIYLGPAARPAVPALVRALDDPDLRTAMAAAEVLGRIGPDAGSAIPELSDRLGDQRYFVEPSLISPTGSRVADALVRIGPAAVPRLTAALQSPDRSTRDLAATALGRIGAGAAPAVPALIAALRAEPTRSTAEALGRIGPQASAAAPALDQLLKDPNTFYDLGEAVALALARLGAPPIEALRAALTDRDLVAVDILSRSGPAAAPAAPALLEALGDDDPELRCVAILALGRIGPRGGGVLDRLLAAVARDGRADACEAGALRRFGPEAHAAIPLLIEGIKGADETDTLAILWAMAGIDPRGSVILPTLIALLRDSPPAGRGAAPWLRTEVCRVVGGLGPAAAPAVPALIALLRADDPELRQEAVRALGRIGPGAAPAVPALIELLEGPDDRLAAEALGQIGPAAAAAGPALLRMLRDSHFIDRLAAVALIRIDRENRAAVRTILEPRVGAMDNPFDRALIATALGRECPQAGAVAGQFRESLLLALEPEAQDELGAWLDTVQEYLEALGELGPSAGVAAPTLRGLRDHPEALIRRWADESLQRIVATPPTKR